MAGTILSGPALLRKVRADFIDSWKSHYEASKEKLGRFCQFGLSTDDFVSAFGYGETPIYPNRTPWGETPDERPHRYRTYTAEQLRWTSSVKWLRRDRKLSNLGSIDRDALKAGRNFGTLFERLFFQIIEAGTDRQLLEAVPNQPIGVAMFSATDEAGAALFGMTGGNIVSGQTLTSGDGIRAALYATIERALTQTDPQGQPAIDEGMIEKGVTLIAPAALTYEVHQAFKQQMVAFAANTDTSNAGVSNVVLDANIPVRIWITPRFTTTRLYIIFDEVHGDGGEPLLAEVVSLPLEEQYIDRSNDPNGWGKAGFEGAFWEHWMCPVVNLARGAFRVTA